ncbi:MAG: winged helix-turn-helix transcriptional regulator [Bacteroidota bacterium]
MLGGKWKVLIVYHLGASGMCRFGELRKRIPAVTQKMLTAALREMEGDGVVERKVYAEVPPRVEYRLTEVGADLHHVYRAMADWGMKHSGLVDKRCGEIIEIDAE